MSYTYAQSKTQLKGPRYKNYKPKINTKSSQKLIKVYATRKYQLKGPKSKNYKPKIARTFKHPYRVDIGQEPRRIGKHKKLNVGTTYRRVRR